MSCVHWCTEEERKQVSDLPDQWNPQGDSTHQLYFIYFILSIIVTHKEISGFKGTSQRRKGRKIHQ